jgi:hypothetical protein
MALPDAPIGLSAVVADEPPESPSRAVIISDGWNAGRRQLARSGRVRVASYLLWLHLLLLAVWVVWLSSFLTGHPLIYSETGVLRPWLLTFSTGPAAVAGLVAAVLAWRLVRYHLVLTLAVATAVFAVVGLRGDVLTPVLVWTNLAAVALIVSGRSAFRS